MKNDRLTDCWDVGVSLVKVTSVSGTIESSQHWVLDVQFGEDANRARTDHSAENLVLRRRMALD
jgi:hypothetical protein